MLEYIFFETDLRDRFVAYIAKRGVSCITQDDSMGMVVAVSEDISKETARALERYYDQLEGEQTELVAEEDGGLRQSSGSRPAEIGK